MAVQLAFNVTRHSDGFVEGMTNIKGLQVDLDEARTIAAHSRASVEFLRRTIVLSTQKALALRRKRARLAGVRRVLKDVVLKFVERERAVRARMERCEFAESVKEVFEAKREITVVSEEFRLECLDLVKDRLSFALLSVKDRMGLLLS